MAKNKAPRDPNAPKRNISAYLLYQNAQRHTFMAQNPGMSFGQLAKYTSAMYAELSPEEKNNWKQKAEDDKERYNRELSAYVPAPGFDARGEAIVGHFKTKSGKAMRDPNAPKRNLSAYLLYQNAMRDQFKSDNPGMSFGQLSKYTSHMYKALTSQERGEWELRAEQDKARFEIEMRSYVPSPGHNAQGNLIAEKHSTKRPKVRKDPNAPKRARGSFVMFTNEARPKIMKEYPSIKFVDLGILLGERWRNLSPEAKKSYEILAAQDKERFNQEMEQYNALKAEVVARSHAEMARTHAEIALNHAEMAGNASQYPSVKQESQFPIEHHHEDIHQETQGQEFDLSCDDQNNMPQSPEAYSMSHIPASAMKQDPEYEAQVLIEQVVNEEPVSEPQQLVAQQLVEQPFTMPQNLLEANEEYYGF